MEMIIMIKFAFYFVFAAKYNAPTIIVESETENSNQNLVCKSDGGYPEGQLRWFDKNNIERTQNAVSDAKQAKSGLFELSSKLSLKKESITGYTCAVFSGSGTKVHEVKSKDAIHKNGKDSKRTGTCCFKYFASVLLHKIKCHHFPYSDTQADVCLINPRCHYSFMNISFRIIQKDFELQAYVFAGTAGYGRQKIADRKT